MSGRIELRRLRALGHHGALVGEQDRAQPFEIDLDVATDVAAGAASDDLADAVDYGALVSAASGVVTEQRFALLESLAVAIADAVAAVHGVTGVTVTIRKVRPPVPYDLGSAGVRYERPAEP